VAVVKATVFYVDERIAVCRINEPDGGVLVAEAQVGEDGSVRVLPQTVRRVTVKHRVNVTLPDEASAQDYVDQLALAIRRFRLRLKKFDRKTLEGSNSVRVLAQARAAMRDLEEFMP
jgi:hypothetical protein